MDPRDHRPDSEIPDFDENGLMRPPWLKYPKIPVGSIGWRMGDGGGYLDDFRLWWKQQTEEARRIVRTTYPPPDAWRPFCADWT
jgi:hypothetical protein